VYYRFESEPALDYGLTALTVLWFAVLLRFVFTVYLKRVVASRGIDFKSKTSDSLVLLLQERLVASPGPLVKSVTDQFIAGINFLFSLVPKVTRARDFESD